MDGETLPVGQRAHVRVTRLLCLLGAILASLYAPLHRPASTEAAPGWWIHLGVAGLLVVLLAASYVSEEIRRRHVGITWGLLCCMMAWTVVLAALNEFAGEYALGVLLMYAVFGGLVALGSASMRPVLSFLVVGALAVGGGLLWPPTLQTSPWALSGALAVVALAEGGAIRWARSMCDRLRTQRQGLREQRNLLDRLVETTPHAVVRVDERGTPIDVSDRAEGMLGPEVDALFGPQHDPTAAEASLVGENGTPDARHPISQVFQAGRSVHNRKCLLRTPDGTQRTLSVSGAPVWGTDGEIREAIFHFEDVTARKHREEALQQAEKEAAEADRLKSALLANMNHEIRTPLTAIIGFAEAIGTRASELELPEATPLPGYADLIEESGKRLLKTLENILDLAQLEAQEMALGVEAVNLAEQARRAVAEYRADAQAKEIDLRLDAAPVEARADENGVQLVLQHLLDNAIKYTTEGGTVEVRTYSEPDCAVLEVEDDGAGMEPAMVDQLFEPFRQASTGLGREYEGAGVGLAVTKEATEQMGGAIEVETEAGTGSRFLAQLPTTDCNAQRRGDDSAEQPVEETAPSPNNRGSLTK